MYSIKGRNNNVHTHTCVILWYCNIQFICFKHKHYFISEVYLSAQYVYVIKKEMSLMEIGNAVVPLHGLKQGIFANWKICVFSSYLPF